MTRLLTAALLLLVSVPALAQSSTPVKGFQAPPKIEAPAAGSVDEVVKDEILRRGNMVQAVGTVQASPLDLIAESLQTPEDDSGKWYITVVTQNECPPCERLKGAFGSAPELKIWANPTDQDKSWSHYQVRNIDDPTQAAWFKGIKSHVPRTPAVVIQPPRDNRYGDNKTTVNIILGYDGDAKKLSDQIRSSIVEYVAAIERPRNGVASSAAKVDPKARGHQQAQQAPPFAIPSDPFAVDPNVSQTPVFPPAQPLTIAQIQAAVQGIQGGGILAPAEFVLQCLQTGLRTVQEVQQAWLLFQQRRTPTPDPQPTPVVPVTPTVIWPSTPTPPQPAQPGLQDLLGNLLKVVLTPQQPAATPSGGLLDLIGLGGLGSWAKILFGFFGVTSFVSMASNVLTVFRSMRKASGGSTLLTDEQFAAIQKLLGALEANTNATNTNNSVAAQELRDAILKAATVTNAATRPAS